MPTTAFSATAAAVAAILAHSLVSVDSTVGLQYGHDGLLLSNGIQVKPARDRKTHRNHTDLEVLSISTNPMITLSFDAKVTLVAGSMSAKHPGTAIAVSTIQNYTSSISHGFPTDSGNWFELMEPDFTMPAGDLFSTKFNLRLWCPAYLTGGTYVYGPS